MRYLVGPVLASLVLATPARADALYSASVIVTGMDARSRPSGLRAALGQVLAKVSGDPALAGDPRLAATDPAPLLRALAYTDRMGDIPRHDEQGSRDRPYDLTAWFDPPGIDAVLRAWGHRPWSAPRPPLRVEITIVPRTGPPMPMRADTDSDEQHRTALLAAAARFGLDPVLPLALPTPITATGPVLSGTLRWSDADARLDRGMGQ